MPSAKPIPSKIADRLISGLKRYRPILEGAKSRDVGEADTVTIVKDMLADLFGYDKYTELTSEYAIRGTYCDLAIKLDGRLEVLIEVKPIGSPLKENHVKQAVDYAANQGVDWVILTNGQYWQVFHVIFARPISADIIVNVDMLSIPAKPTGDIEQLYLWCKEGWQKSMLSEYRDLKQALSKFFIGSVLLSEPVLTVIRRELRRLTPDVRVDNEQLSSVLAGEVIKREVLEGEGAEDARRKWEACAHHRLRETRTEENAASPSPLPPATSDTSDTASTPAAPEEVVLPSVSLSDPPPSETLQ
jgi:hypothetical protein